MGLVAIFIHFLITVVLKRLPSGIKQQRPLYSTTGTVPALTLHFGHDSKQVMIAKYKPTVISEVIRGLCLRCFVPGSLQRFPERAGPVLRVPAVAVVERCWLGKKGTKPGIGSERGPEPLQHLII